MKNSKFITFIAIILILSIISIPNFDKKIEFDNQTKDFTICDIPKIPNTANIMDYTDIISKESVNNSEYSALAIDLNGNVHVAWEDQFNYEGAGDDYDIFYKYYSNSTGEWSELKVVSTESTADSERVKLAVDEDGNIHFVWSDDTDIYSSGVDADIFYKNYSIVMNEWSNTIVVSTESTLGSYGPSIALDEEGNIHVAWHDSTDYDGAGTDVDIFYKNYTIATNTWSVTDVVSTESTSNSYKANIKLDKIGNIHIVWEDSTFYSGAGTDLDIFYKNYTIATNTWSVTDVVSTESGDNSQKPSLIVDEVGNIHIAWEDYSNYNGAGTNWDIFYKNYTVSIDFWSLTEVISIESSLNSYYPSLGIDKIGNLHIAYEGTTNYNGAGNDRDIFYKNYTKSMGAWNNAEVISTESTSNSFYCSLDLDPNNNVHIAWEDLTNYTGVGTDRDIFYKINIMNNTSPIIDTPNDLSYTVGSTGNEISWIVTDNMNYKPFYEVFFNETLNTSDTWISGVAIDVKIDDLPVGDHNITIIANDGYGATIQDTVIVTVTFTNVAPSISSPNNIMYIFGSTSNSIEWIPSDTSTLNPTFQILFNGTLNSTSNWISGVPIHGSIDDLNVGDHNITIILYDGYGATIQDSVIVTVTANVAPIISSPIDIMYDFGSTGNSIEWIPTDGTTSNPTFQILFNGTLNSTSTWTSEIAINISIDGLPVGNHNITIILYDGCGALIQDMVIVTVANLAPIITSPIDIMYDFGSTGNSIEWIPSDTSTLNPTFQILFNGTLNSTSTWTSEIAINISIDGLPVGNHNITIILYDGYGSSIQDTVMVIVSGDEKNSNPRIYGYNNYIIATFIGITILILFQKSKMNSIKKLN